LVTAGRSIAQSETNAICIACTYIHNVLLLKYYDSLKDKLIIADNLKPILHARLFTATSQEFILYDIIIRIHLHNSIEEYTVMHEAVKI